MRLILASLVICLVGCVSGKAWVIERNQTGGIIGYQNYKSGEEAQMAVESLMQCSSYNMVYDRLNSTTGVAYMPMQNTNYSSGMVSTNSGGYANYSEQQTATQYVPIQTVNAWRELRYECASDSSGSASGKPLWSKWTGAETGFDLTSARFGTTQELDFIFASGPVCRCALFMNGTDSAGKFTLSSCSYFSGGKGNPGCALLNDQGTYVKSPEGLRICDSVGCTDYR